MTDMLLRRTLRDMGFYALSCEKLTQEIKDKRRFFSVRPSAKLRACPESIEGTNGEFLNGLFSYGNI